ncbi:hypothetical protein, partial [Burkholderia sp. Ac-20345]|uniref:hypothetical protein n=1 Tax=Burkholderia sp. Ac-20345 TaxID=2703891 RepID=UPI001F11A4CF
MNVQDDTLEFTGGLVARLPEPADFGIALAEGFARRLGDLSRRAGAPAARRAARADRKGTRLNSSHLLPPRIPPSALQKQRLRTIPIVTHSSDVVESSLVRCSPSLRT